MHAVQHQDPNAAGSCARLCESLRGAEAFADSDGLDAFIAVAMGQNASGKGGGLMVALAQALMAEMTDFKVAVFEVLAAAATWPSLRGRVAGSGVLGVITATLLAPRHPASVKALMARLCGILTVDVPETTRLGDARRAEEFAKLRGQLVSSGATKAIVELSRVGKGADAITTAAAAIASLAGYGSDAGMRAALADAGALTALLEHLPGYRVAVSPESAADGSAPDATEADEAAVGSDNAADGAEAGIASRAAEDSAATGVEDSAATGVSGDSTQSADAEASGDDEDSGDGSAVVAVSSSLAALAASEGDGVEALIAPLREPRALASLRAFVSDPSSDHRAVAKVLECLAIEGRRSNWPVLDGSLSEDLARLLVLGGDAVAEAAAEFLLALLSDRALASKLGDLQPLLRAARTRGKKGGRHLGLVLRALEEAKTCGHCGAVSPQALLACSACRGVEYCSRDCQKAAWPTHKAVCAKSKKK